MPSVGNGLQLVLVEWVDSHAGRGWRSETELRDGLLPLRCRSVGWLFAKTKDCLRIVPHIHAEENSPIVTQGCGDMTIPRRSVIRMIVLPTPKAAAS